MQLHTQNDEIKTKRCTFSLVSDIDVKNSFFNAKLNIRYQ